MPDDADNRPDGGIEPSVQQITLLAPALSARERRGISVLPPFVGLLQAGRYRPDDRRRDGPRRPPLSYLTLEPLVLRHLREHTVEERPVERLERVEPDEPPGERARAGRPEQGDDEETRMTVREFIREQATDSSGEPAAPDQMTQLTGFTWHTTTLHQQRAETRQPVETESTRESPLSIGWTRMDDTQREPGLGEISGSEGTDQPPHTLDTASRSEREFRTTGQGEVPRDASGFLGAASSRSGTGDELPGPGDSQPALVLPRRPPTMPPRGQAGGDTGSARDRSVEPSSVDRGQPGDRGRARSESGRSAADATEGSTAVRQASSDSRARESSGRDEEAVPLSLDELERPTLDRFVEQLSDELARHDRIERERRGL